MHATFGEESFGRIAEPHAGLISVLVCPRICAAFFLSSPLLSPFRAQNHQQVVFPTFPREEKSGLSLLHCLTDCLTARPGESSCSIAADLPRPWCRNEIAEPRLARPGYVMESKLLTPVVFFPRKVVLIVTNYNLVFLRCTDGNFFTVIASSRSFSLPDSL